MSKEISRKYQKVHAFLRHNPMGILSTVDPEGKPWGAAIYYVADQDFNFYFVTKVGTLKYQNLDKNPLAALTIADIEDQTTVQASGTVSKIPAKDYIEIVFKKLSKARPGGDGSHWSPPLAKIKAGNYMPLRLTPTKLQYADYRDHSSDSRTGYIEKIIP